MTLRTQGFLRQAVLRRLGGQVVNVDSGTTTTFLSTDLEYSHGGDDNGLNGWLCYCADLTDTDGRRSASSYDDSLGKVTVDTMSDTPASGDTLELYPPGSPLPHEINYYLDRTLEETKRSVWTYIPTADEDRVYSLVDLPWIETAADVLAVYVRNSPNLLNNEGFELWGDGTTANMPSWALAGNNATVTRLTGVRHGYSARLTRSGTDCYLEQSIPWHEQLRGDTLTLSAICTSSTNSTARITVYDGVGTTNGTVNSGTTRATLSATHTVNAAATELKVRLERITQNGTADWENAICVEGSSIPAELTDTGSTQASISDVQYRITNDIAPAIFLKERKSRGQQLVVVSLQRHFPLVSSPPDYVVTGTPDNTGTTDFPVEAAVAGTVMRLAKVRKWGRDHTKWEDLEREFAPQYATWAARLAQVPTPDLTTNQVVIRSA